MKRSIQTPWELPNTLKRAQLQQIATLIGAPLTGTKPELNNHIRELLSPSHLHYPRQDAGKRLSKVERPLRVLSIDMGIRNLAYAFLTLPSVRDESGGRISWKPTLSRWQRVNLSKFTLSSDLGETKASASLIESDEPIVNVAESFEPQYLSLHAYKFAKYCATLEPTHILIERQRFRSGGQSAVQEWSLRVGMLEGMLYAAFRTLIEEKLLPGTQIEPVLPMRINKFWFANDENIPATGKAAKLAKIKIVSDMLMMLGSKDEPFELGTGIDEVVARFGVKIRSKVRIIQQDAKALNKFDDMADSLLQGLAWIRWQENRAKLLESGPECLVTEV